MAQNKKHPLFNDQYFQAAEMRKGRLVEMNIDPYPVGSKNLRRTHTCESFNEEFDYINADNVDKEIKVRLSGKIVLWRNNGKMIFGNIQDVSDKRAQVFFSVSDTENYDLPKKTMTAGDIISVVGYPFRTQKGELTLKVTNATMASKAMTPPPEKFHGLQDEETKYRNRHLHMLSDPTVKQTLLTRAKIISIVRNFLNKKDFSEQETQVLQEIAGGANARPFITHHNSLGADRFLRIAPELQLKKLLIGGIEKVYELNKCYRNEGVDATHNPEFTSVEFYEAYATYKQHMKMIEKLFKKIYRKVLGDKEYMLPYGELTINLDNWQKIPFREALLTIGNIPEDIIDEVEPLSMYLREQGVDKANGTLPLGKLWEIAFDEFVEEKLIDPTFITEYPVDISPLARRNNKNPFLTDRFELFIAGRELANGFNELNDPVDQYNRFQAQVDGKDLDDEDDESMVMDLSFIKALMSGMPPAAGTGIGIDRLVMLFTNKASIRDVIAFPAMK